MSFIAASSVFATLNMMPLIVVAFLLDPSLAAAAKHYASALRQVSGSKGRILLRLPVASCCFLLLLVSPFRV